jgi:hypothetical protein
MLMVENPNTSGMMEVQIPAGAHPGGCFSVTAPAKPPVASSKTVNRRTHASCNISWVCFYCSLLFLLGFGVTYGLAMTYNMEDYYNGC